MAIEVTYEEAQYAMLYAGQEKPVDADYAASLARTCVALYEERNLLRGIAEHLRAGHAPSRQATGPCWRIPPRGAGSTEYVAMSEAEARILL